MLACFDKSNIERHTSNLSLTWRNGRRVRLRTVWGNPWRFDSSREHFPEWWCQVADAQLLQRRLQAFPFQGVPWLRLL
jgi:hypothetical protein